MSFPGSTTMSRRDGELLIVNTLVIVIASYVLLLLHSESDV